MNMSEILTESGIVFSFGVAIISIIAEKLLNFLRYYKTPEYNSEKTQNGIRKSLMVSFVVIVGFIIVIMAQKFVPTATLEVINGAYIGFVATVVLYNINEIRLQMKYCITKEENEIEKEGK